MENIELPRLIYLGVLILVLGGWVFARYRGRMAQAMQLAILWLLLFAGAILLYGFKDDLQRQVFPSQAAVVSGDKIVLRRAADRHFYATLKINGQDIVFLVDTGATDIVLTQKDARAVGMDVAALRYLGTAHTANGTVRTARIKLKLVEFGDQIDKNVAAWVNDGEMNTSLLGMAYLSRYSSIEIAGDQMFLKR